MDMIETLAKELSIGRQQAESAVRLLDEDNTIPFIARYRKEVTGGLDDTVLRALEERMRYLRSLQKRREEVFALIQASGKLNEQQLNQVEASLQRANLLSEVEDIYRPYKQKRKTRASAAREKGLEPLAQFLQAQRQGSSLEQEAQKFIDPKKRGGGCCTGDCRCAGHLGRAAERFPAGSGKIAGLSAKKCADFDNYWYKRK